MGSEAVLDWEDNTEGIPYIKHATAGSIAGVVEHLAIFPIDTIKTHLQVDVRSTDSAMRVARTLW